VGEEPTQPLPANLTFAKDVLPIAKAHCSLCHGTMSITKFKGVESEENWKSNKAAIADRLQKPAGDPQRMPASHAGEEKYTNVEKTLLLAYLTSLDAPASTGSGNNSTPNLVASPMATPTPTPTPPQNVDNRTVLNLEAWTVWQTATGKDDFAQGATVAFRQVNTVVGERGRFIRFVFTPIK
jgi:hypothetical protein